MISGALSLTTTFRIANRFNAKVIRHYRERHRSLESKKGGVAVERGRVKFKSNQASISGDTSKRKEERMDFLLYGFAIDETGGHDGRGPCFESSS